MGDDIIDSSQYSLDILLPCAIFVGMIVIVTVHKAQFKRVLVLIVMNAILLHTVYRATGAEQMKKLCDDTIRNKPVFFHNFKMGTVEPMYV
jgi:hypothetical protein